MKFKNYFHYNDFSFDKRQKSLVQLIIINYGEEIRADLSGPILSERA